MAAAVSLSDTGTSFAISLLKKFNVGIEQQSQPISSASSQARRPARLGLGATPAKKTATSDVGERVLKQIKKSKRKAAEDGEETPTAAAEPDVDIPDDSKTAHVHKKQPKASPLDLMLNETQKKKKGKANAEPEPAPPSQPEVEPSASAAEFFIDTDGFMSNWVEPTAQPCSTTPISTNAKADVPKTAAVPPSSSSTNRCKSENSKTPTNTAADKAVDKGPTSLSQRGDEVRGNFQVPGDTTSAVPKKRKKIRSKQKNLRKDRRPEHLKPTYRTPGDPKYAPPKPAWKARKNQEGNASQDD